MATPVPPADAELLRKLLAGDLPPAEADLLTVTYADDGRLDALARTLDGNDTLVEALRGHESAGPFVTRLKAALLRQNATAVLPAEVIDDGDGPEPLPETMEYFRIEKVLGEGGMGTVYLAEDTRLGRKVAIKTLKKDIAKKAGAKDRFFREARTAAKLDHDHVIPIHYVGEAHGVPFLAMPFLKGHPLDAVLKKAKGRMPAAEILRVGREIALGLAAAHDAGLIHRDIKPANVWLEAPNGRVKILDFGLARSQGEEGQLTASGAIMGTPAYMAPEQARGKPVDGRADLFSLGVMLYEMTTGKKPFTGPDMMAILTSLATDDPPPARALNSEVPANLSDLIARLMAKDPGRRPPTAQAVADELMQLAVQSSRPTVEVLPAADPWGGIDDGEAETLIAPTPKSHARPAAVKRAPNKWLIAGASLLVLLAVTAGVIVIVRDKDGKKIAEVTVPTGGKVEIIDAGGKPKPAAPAAKRAALEVHGVTLEVLKDWAAKLPKGHRPAWISARAGGGPLFDAVAAVDPESSDWKLMFRTLPDDKPYTELTKTHRLAATASFANGGHMENFVLGVNDGLEWEYWYGGADFIAEKVEAGLKFDRVEAGVKERWLPLSMAAYKAEDGTTYELVMKWQPDRPCRWHPALNADDLAKKVAENRTQGWRPHIVNVHANEADATFIAAFFENKANEQWAFTAGLTVEEYEKQLIDRQTKGQRPRCVCSHVVKDKAVYTVVWDGPVSDPAKK